MITHPDTMGQIAAFEYQDRVKKGTYARLVQEGSANHLPGPGRLGAMRFAAGSRLVLVGQRLQGGYTSTADPAMAREQYAAT